MNDLRRAPMCPCDLIRHTRHAHEISPGHSGGFPVVQRCFGWHSFIFSVNCHLMTPGSVVFDELGKIQPSLALTLRPAATQRARKLGKGAIKKWRALGKERQADASAPP